MLLLCHGIPTSVVDLVYKVELIDNKYALLELSTKEESYY